MDIKDKVVLVTGGASGLGLATVRRLADAGAKVVIASVSPIFDERRRLAPLTTSSRLLTKADAGCTIGQHTDAVLREIGVDQDRVADLRERKIVA